MLDLARARIANCPHGHARHVNHQDQPENERKLIVRPVGDHQWNEEKKAAVERISVILLTNGYSGARFFKRDGSTVARWLVDRGGQLVDTAVSCGVSQVLIEAVAK